MGQFAQFGGGGAIVGRGDDVFGGAAQLEEAVLEVGDLGVGEHDGVFWQAAALERGAAFVGALAAGLAAVAPALAAGLAFFETSATPAAVGGRAGSAHPAQFFAGHAGFLGHLAHGDDPSWPSSAHAEATPGRQTVLVKTSHPYLADPLPRALAHRGWHLDELADMENSLSAFRRAADEGYRYVETDVHATSDGVAVAQHDPTLDRTTDASGLVGSLPWAQVRLAKIGGREGVSRLEDVLEELPETRFNVDLKTDAVVGPFVRVLERMNAFDRVAAASFSDARLARVRRLAGPRLLTALGPRSAGVLWANGWLPFLRLGFLSRGAMAQVPVRQGRVKLVDRSFVRAAGYAGVEVHCWTIDEADQMRALLDLGVKGLVTDRPDVLREVLVERGVWEAA